MFDKLLVAEQTGEKEKLPDGPSGSGTTHGYMVQARYTHHKPAMFEGQILDKEWRTLYFKENAVGVPAGARYEMPEFIHANCYSHQAAQALRWWFVANAHAQDVGGSLCLETRLVEYTIEYSYKATPARVIDCVERADRPRAAAA